MKTLLGAAVLTALFAIVSAAQWSSYPTPGVPRLADGKPNLNAPAPRPADGKPDLSGIWETFRPGGGQRGEGPRGAPAEAAPAPPAPAAADSAAAAGPPLATFRDAGAGIKG